MAHPGTERFLEEITHPELIDQAETAAAVKTFVPALSKITQQVARLEGLLHESELEEEDAALLGKYEELFQQLGAMRRLAGEIEQRLRRLVLAYRDFDTISKEMKERVK